MKKSLSSLCLALFLSSCAGVRVTHTDTATGATDPSAIYLRRFDVADCVFTGHHHSPGELPIRKSLAPAEFTGALKEELEKIAPSLVLKDGDTPEHGWLVEGSLDYINSGSPLVRAIPGNLFGYGASHVRIHVRIIDLDARGAASEAKDTASTESAAAAPGKGAVIYEFDVAGGSRVTGKFGSVTAPGIGYAPMFDYRNAAERIAEAVTPDPHRLGVRDGDSIR